MVLVNPRRTETAHALSNDGGCEQVFIRPDTDPFLLMAMLRVLYDDGRVQRLEHLRGVDALGEAVRSFEVADAAAATGVPAGKIVELARSFAGAESANAYCSTGVNMGSNGSLIQWFIPRSRSLITNTGVCRRSARSNAR